VARNASCQYVAVTAVFDPLESQSFRHEPKPPPLLGASFNDQPTLPVAVPAIGITLDIQPP
jgi:hypothetical protein